MEFKKLDIKTLSREQFSQMVVLENNCGLEPYSPAMLRECIETMDTFAYIENQRILGFITIYPSTRYMGGGVYIVNLNVAQEYHRQGIASKLLQNALNCYAATHTDQPVILDVSKNNTPAVKLYEKMGFVVMDVPSANGPSDMVMATPISKLLGIATTSRLVLKKLADADAADTVEILMHDTVKKTYMLPDLTEDSATKLFERLKDLSHSQMHFIRGIYLDNKLIGFINDTEMNDGEIELGWVVHPDYHNRGYATEAVGAAIKALFAGGFTEVVAGAFSQNRASIRVMEKNGMERLDKTEQIEYRGCVHECVFYSVKKVTK